MIDLALIGAGRWGRVYMRTIAGMPGVRLVRVCSRQDELRDIVAPGCEVVAELEQAIAPGIDGVIVSTSPAFHVPIAIACVQNGLPVLVEKPLGLDLAEATRLLDLATARAVPVLVDHTQLFHPAYHLLKARVSAIGPIRAIESIGGGPGPFRADVTPLWDWGPHDLALAIDLMGHSPCGVRLTRAQIENTARGLGTNLSLALDFHQGVVARITVGNLMAEKKRRLTVDLDGHRLVFDELAADPLVEHTHDGNTRTPIAVGCERPLTEAIRAFAAAIEHRTVGLSDIHLGVAVVDVLAQCQAALDQMCLT